MIPAAFDYARAQSLQDALQALAARDGTTLIAGGQSLLPILKLRLGEAPKLVDIGQLAELKGIEEEGATVRIGAGTTYRELLDSDLLRESHPIIAEATEHIGDRQVRNLGTIGGGLVHADPASDMPAVMLALDAAFTLQSSGGERSVMAREFFIAPFATAMNDDELLTAIALPALPGGAGTAYVSFDQAASGYALVGAAAVVATSGGKVSRADIAFTGLADTPFLVDGGGLIGTGGEEDIVEQVADKTVHGVDANDDIHASAEYRLHLGSIAAKRALIRALERAG